MDQADFVPKPYADTVNSGQTGWSAPSNIALVKYWGKRENQLPANPSLSFTLNECTTNTHVGFEKKASADISFDILLDGTPRPDFAPKIHKFFDRTKAYLPFITDYHFTIDTHNTFPHSSGIASSASGMAALALNMMSIERMLQPEMAQDHFLQKASFLARLGSGSACRSITGSAVAWGKHEEIPGSNDLTGVDCSSFLHENFQDYKDAILLVDRGEKQVSSTVGHDLMHGHPFASERFAQAHQNITQLKQALMAGDLENFIRITESEALTLHAMMMTSNPYFILMKPNTLEIINKIWSFRKASNIPVCFTLDAGANVHMLYPAADDVKIQEFIKNELVGHCQNGQYICDELGHGAKQLVAGG